MSSMNSYGVEPARSMHKPPPDFTGRTAIDLTTEPNEPTYATEVYRDSFTGRERQQGHAEKRQKTQTSYEAQNGDGIEITSSKFPPASSPSQARQHQSGPSGADGPRVNSQPHFGYPSFQPPPYAGPSNYASKGSSQDNVIDLTNRPSPPPAPPKQHIDRKPLCIGAVHSKVTMLYPSPVVVQGQDISNNRESLMIVPFHEAEMLKVKLKLRVAGAPLREMEPVASADHDVVQVLSPSSSIYIGELDQDAQKIFQPLLQRGLIRLEGFVQRIHPDAHQYQATIFVLVFTLPSNVMFIANHLASNRVYLMDPMPPYDASRHNDSIYENAHKDYYIRNGADRYGGMGGGMNVGMYGVPQPGQTKVNTIEVQREQVDEVFKSLKDDMKLAETEPGPFIKTKLFTHQKQALTFLREEEREPAAIEAAMNARISHAAKLELEEEVKAEEAGVSVVGRDGKPENTIPKYRKRDRPKEDWTGRSLWETHKDETGKVTGYKNRITAKEVKAHKDVDRPSEARGAILADDMGLGKTLSIVSLIASTLATARDFASGEVALPPAAAESVKLSDNKAGLSAAHFAGKVHGMPQTAENSEAENTETAGRTKHKKRKHAIEEDKQRSSFARRSRIAQRTRATLLVCPLSTVSNWEEQIKEHWAGEVYVVGGAAGIAPPKKPAATWAGKKKEAPADVLSDDVFRVYIYHGNSRRPDPEYISNFDVVITTFSTLATEFSKLRQVSSDQDESPTPTEDGSENGTTFDVDTAGVPIERSAVELEAAALEATTKGRGKGKASEKLGPKAACETASPLQSLEWFRVVLDEAHFIKESSTVASRAACYLEAERRIALTGTPIQNKLDDVWALFKFLRLTPLDERDVFVEQVLSQCKLGNQVGLARLQLIMRSCTLRRTKDMTGEDGKKILELPERKEYQQWLTFRDDELEIYNSIKEAVAKKVEELKNQKALGKNYATVLQQAMRLRQICDHVDLIKSGAVEEDYDGTVMDYDVAVAGIEANGLNQARGVSIIAYLKDTDAARCVECDTELADRFPSLTLGDDDLKPEEERGETDVKSRRKKATNPVLTKCQHIYCLACFRKAVCPTYPKNIKGVGRPCSACNRGLRLQYDALEIAPPGTQDDMLDTAPARPPRKRYQRPPGEKPTLSTKMTYLLEKLMASSRVNKHSKNYDVAALSQLKAEECNSDGSPIEIKTVVFSQWTTMLDRIGDMLEECQIKYARLDGTMSRDDRSAAMLALKADPATEILLVSIRAGGVGLNLVTASRCFIMEPYWNPSVEAQAIDRIHRMGQTRPVEAIKLMMNDSIEVKMSERQKKKNSLAKLTLKGMTKAELLERRMEELVALFS